MADYKVTDTELSSIANAIRTKGGTSSLLEFPDDFITAINALPSPTPSVDIVPFATGTDAQISAMIDAAQNGDIDLQQDGGWAVGDARTIHIDAFTGGGNTSHAAQDADIVISSFDEYMSCGNVMQFDFKSVLATEQRMNATDTNVGGYGQSEMKITTIPALVNALPSWLKNRLIEFSVLASAGNQSSTIQTITGNKLALRSEVEILPRNYSYSGEGTQIEYYNTVANRQKANTFWFTRSPYMNNSTAYCVISFTGSTATRAGSNANGFSPFGCL